MATGEKDERVLEGVREEKGGEITKEIGYVSLSCYVNIIFILW